jgi:hypothetical protein
MPWIPELFSAPVLARFEEKRWHEKLVALPYFTGLMAGEPGALIESFAAEPELYDPVRGRVKGTRAFEAFVTEMNAWLVRCNVSVEDVEHVVTERHGFEEVVLHLDGQTGRVALPLALVADRQPDGRIDELRIYSSKWGLTGRHTHRPPLLQPDPELRESDVVAEYQRALAAGDVDARCSDSRSVCVATVSVVSVSALRQLGIGGSTPIGLSAAAVSLRSAFSAAT